MVGYFAQAVRGVSGTVGPLGGRTACRYVGGADVTAACQRGEPAHVDADEPQKHFGFTVAKHGDPGAGVGSLRTPPPRSRENTSVSTSQNTGNLVASCWMGQCPWHSWTLD